MEALIMNIETYVKDKVTKAKEAARTFATVSSKDKDAALLMMAQELENNKDNLISQNTHDINYAKNKGLSQALIDRLTLNEKRISEMAEGLIQIASLKDPVGEITGTWQRPNGMTVGKMRVPIGVIGIIYESRPNVTADATALCLKAGNASVLRGGSEALNSNKAIVTILQETLHKCNLPPDVVTFIDIPERDAVLEMLKSENSIDLIIPRGGEGLIRAVVENSRIPVIKHYKGVCHVFVDRDADLTMANDICFNAKVQRPGTCNALETMLVDENIAHQFLPPLVERFKNAQVKIKGCERTRQIAPEVESLTEDDFYNEYLDLTINVKVVAHMDEAITHIEKYGSHHTDTIVTKDFDKAMKFLRTVDSSSVMVNVSTRFSDGFQYGLGAEIGISTDKIHARGPMGLEDLTCTKYIVMGQGQLRQ
jgi:glutamate-5-semialdehyde dehydrogenase